MERTTHGLIVTLEEFTVALPQLESSKLHWQVWNAEEIFLGQSTSVEIEVSASEFSELKEIFGR